MCSSDEILSLLDKPIYLAKLLKENPNLSLTDSTLSHIANYFLHCPISVEGLSVQRNLYGRIRSLSLNQMEINLLIFNIKECFRLNSQELTKPFLQYLHNINRLLPNDFHNLAYLCALILLPNGNRNILACIFCAYLESNSFNDARFDLIINGLFTNKNDEEEENQWIDRLIEILIDKDKQWLRKYYLERIYTEELLHAIDTYEEETILVIQGIKQNSEQSCSKTIEELE